MKLSELCSELKNSRVYKNFISRYPDAFFTTAFFMFDVVKDTEDIHLDFFVPSLHKLASFHFPFTAEVIHKEEVLEALPQNETIHLDIDNIVSACKKSISQHNAFMKPTKIIAVLQGDEWNCTCMDDALGIIRIKYNASSGEEVFFKKDSLMNFMQVRKSSSQ